MAEPDKYRVLIEHRAREGRDHPLVIQRHTVSASSSREALALALTKREVAALAGSLLVRATVSKLGPYGAKS